MSDDWPVVEEALQGVEREPYDQAFAALARLREREQTLEDNRTTWMYRAEAAEARVAELEKVTQGRYGEVVVQLQRRIAELEASYASCCVDRETLRPLVPRVARLEEALREIEAVATLEGAKWAARSALAHEEETSSE